MKMGKSYKVWIEIEEHSAKGEPKGGGDIGILPDCIGVFDGKGALPMALKHIASIVSVHGIDPENSDSVKATEKGRRFGFTDASDFKRAVKALGSRGLMGVTLLRMADHTVLMKWATKAEIGSAKAVILACGGFEFGKPHRTCKRCGSDVRRNGRCKDRTCPYSDRQQHEAFTEG